MEGRIVGVAEVTKPGFGAVWCSQLASRSVPSRIMPITTSSARLASRHSCANAQHGGNVFRASIVPSMT